MATYTIKVLGTCTGGEHIKLGVYRNGAFLKNISVTRTEVLQTDLNWDEVLPFFLRECIKRSGATTLAQAKTAVEAAEWSF